MQWPNARVRYAHKQTSSAFHFLPLPTYVPTASFFVSILISVDHYRTPTAHPNSSFLLSVATPDMFTSISFNENQMHSKNSNSSSSPSNALPRRKLRSSVWITHPITWKGHFAHTVNHRASPSRRSYPMHLPKMGLQNVSTGHSQQWQERCCSMPISPISSGR